MPPNQLTAIFWRMKKLLTILLMAAVSPSVLFSIEENLPAAAQYKQAHELFTQADEMRDAGSLSQAINLYGEAQALYIELATKYPGWQANVVKFRTVYCKDQIEAILKELSENNRVRPETLKPTGIPRTTDIKKLRSTTASAGRLLKEGKHVQARMLLLDAINIEPDDPEARLLLGIAQCQAGKYTDSIYILEELVSENPSNAQAFTVLGASHLALGNTDKAKENTAKAIKLNSELKEANFNMAQILAVSTPPDKASALKYYKKAISLGAMRNAVLEVSLK